MMHYVSDYSGTLSFPQTSLNHHRQRMVVTQEETTHQIKSLIMLQFPTSKCPICLSEQLRVIAHRSLLRCDFSSPTGTFRILESFCCGFHWNKGMTSRFLSHPGKSDVDFLCGGRTHLHTNGGQISLDMFLFWISAIHKIDLLLRGLFNGTNAPSSTSQVFSPFFPSSRAS